jgi:hypothetical protein
MIAFKIREKTSFSKRISNSEPISILKKQTKRCRDLIKAMFHYLDDFFFLVKKNER